jgi:hypothetical protein
MATEQTKLEFRLSAEQKEAVRKAADAKGVSMAELARQATLETVPSEIVADVEPQSPLTKFATDEIRVLPRSEPVPKSRVYQWYENYCDREWPNHSVETRHKVSRAVKKLSGVETGRRYITTENGDRQRKRCFLNVDRQ